MGCGFRVFGFRVSGLLGDQGNKTTWEEPAVLARDAWTEHEAPATGKTCPRQIQVPLFGREGEGLTFRLLSSGVLFVLFFSLPLVQRLRFLW